MTCKIKIYIGKSGANDVVNNIKKTNIFRDNKTDDTSITSMESYGGMSPEITAEFELVSPDLKNNQFNIGLTGKVSISGVNLDFYNKIIEAYKEIGFNTIQDTLNYDWLKKTSSKEMIFMLVSVFDNDNKEFSLPYIIFDITVSSLGTANITVNFDLQGANFVALNNNIDYFNKVKTMNKNETLTVYDSINSCLNDVGKNYFNVDEQLKNISIKNNSKEKKNILKQNKFGSFSDFILEIENNINSFLANDKKVKLNIRYEFDPITLDFKRTIFDNVSYDITKKQFLIGIVGDETKGYSNPLLDNSDVKFFVTNESNFSKAFVGYVEGISVVYNTDLINSEYILLDSDYIFFTLQTIKFCYNYRETGFFFLPINKKVSINPKGISSIAFKGMIVKEEYIGVLNG